MKGKAINTLRKSRQYHRIGFAVALIMALGLLVAACGGRGADEPEAEKEIAKGGQQAKVDLPPFPPAPQNAGNSRLRVPGGPSTHEELIEWAITDAAAKWQAAFAEVDVSYSTVYYNLYAIRREVYGFVVFAIQRPAGLIERSTARVDGLMFDPGTETLMKSYGDFAMAVVAAHEVGHHVQDELGLLDEQYPKIQTELQADCFAGVWGSSVYDRLEPGDIGEAMEISWDSGDLPGTPRNAPGAHGKPEERVKWFRTGYDTGDADECLALTPLPEETTTSTTSR